MDIANNALPYDHPVVLNALTGASIATRDAADRLGAQGHAIRLIWRETMPEFAYGEGPRPGRVLLDPFLNEVDDLDRETPVGTQVGTGFKTARTHTLTTSDGLTLALPVWRWGRKDLPHTPVCQRDQQGLACKDCGTGDYWLLPEYIRPAWTPGLSDPADRTRLRGEITLLMGLGAKPLKVYLTDHARYARGTIGSPERVRTARLMRVWSGPDHDSVVVKFRNGGEAVVRPDEVRLKEDDTDLSS